MVRPYSGALGVNQPRTCNICGALHGVQIMWSNVGGAYLDGGIYGGQSLWRDLQDTSSVVQCRWINTRGAG
eukprot:5677488-Pyramimonas_sp.AAC.1